MSSLPIPSTRPDFTTVKTAIHRRLIQKLNLDRLADVKREDVRREVTQILESLVVGESTPMNLQERERLAQLEQFQRLTVGRELRMIELKKEIEYLSQDGPVNGREPGDE